MKKFTVTGSPLIGEKEAADDVYVSIEVVAENGSEALKTAEQMHPNVWFFSARAIKTMNSVHFYTVRGVRETDGGCVDITVEHVLAAGVEEASKIAADAFGIVVVSVELWKNT